MISFSGLCQYFSEITLYLSTVRFIFALIGEIQNPWPVAGIFLGAGIISASFSRFEGFKAYLPMLLVIPSYLMAESVTDMVCITPLAVLLFFHIMRKRWSSDSVVLLGSLKAGLGMFFFVLVAAAVAAKIPMLTAESVPLFVLFMGTVILGMRVLRNEEMGKTGPVFYILNTLLVALIAGVGFVFSNSWLLGAVKTCLKFLYDKILGPILMGVTYVVIILPMLLGWLLDRIQLKEPEPVEEVFENVFGNDELQDLYEEMEKKIPPEWVPKLFAAFGIIIFLIIAFLIIRKLVDYSSAKKPSGGSFERMSVAGEDAPKKRRRRRNTNADAVRACYRKYLDICEDITIPVDGSIASDEIAARSRHCTGDGPTGALRQLWLPARYSENASTEEDAKLAKQYLKEIKKNSKQD